MSTNRENNKKKRPKRRGMKTRWRQNRREGIKKTKKREWKRKKGEERRKRRGIRKRKEEERRKRDSENCKLKRMSFPLRHLFMRRRLLMCRQNQKKSLTLDAHLFRRNTLAERVWSLSRCKRFRCQRMKLVLLLCDPWRGKFIKESRENLKPLRVFYWQKRRESIECPEIMKSWCCILFIQLTLDAFLWDSLFSTTSPKSTFILTFSTK